MGREGFRSSAQWQVLSPRQHKSHQESGPGTCSYFCEQLSCLWPEEQLVNVHGRPKRPAAELVNVNASLSHLEGASPSRWVAARPSRSWGTGGCSGLPGSQRLLGGTWWGSTAGSGHWGWSHDLERHAKRTNSFHITKNMRTSTVSC